MPEPEQRLTYAEAAAYLRVPERTLRAARSSGRLEHYRIGRRVEFTKAQLDRWLAEQRRIAR